MPTIDKPTRVYNNSNTLIDNILTNKVDVEITSGNIISHISDHFSQFCISHNFIQRPKPVKQKRRNFSGYSKSKFNSELSNAFASQTNFNDQFDVDTAFYFFPSLRAGRILLILQSDWFRERAVSWPLTRAELFAASFTSLFVVCEWAETVTFIPFFF